MSRIKAWWQSISRKWRLAIIIVAAGVILGVGGVYGSLAYFAANPSACGTCHLIDPYVESYYESDFLDNAHAEAEDQVKCKECHDVALIQIAAELVTFVTGNYELPLEQREYPQEFCTTCHPVEDVLEATTKANRPEFERNPHWNHIELVEGIVECQECHRAHRGGLNFCYENCHGLGYGYTPNK
jgi:hypothetical protein